MQFMQEPRVSLQVFHLVDIKIFQLNFRLNENFDLTVADRVSQQDSSPGDHECLRSISWQYFQ